MSQCVSGFKAVSTFKDIIVSSILNIDVFRTKQSAAAPASVT